MCAITYSVSSLGPYLSAPHTLGRHNTYIILLTHTYTLSHTVTVSPSPPSSRKHSLTQKRGTMHLVKGKEENSTFVIREGMPTCLELSYCLHSLHACMYMWTAYKVVVFVSGGHANCSLLSVLSVFTHATESLCVCCIHCYQSMFHLNDV